MGTLPPTQGALFGAAASAESGYRGPQVCALVGITYRQLDYWARTDLLRPSIEDAKGSGSQRIYSYRDLVSLKVIKKLLDAGMSLQSVRRAITYLHDHMGEDIASANLVIDGTRAVLADNGQLIELISGGQGVLNIVAMGAVVNELDATISDLAEAKAAKVKAADSTIAFAEGHRLLMADANGPVPEETSEAASAPETVRFQHNSERQFARLLDFYGIEWQYEPQTFVLETDADGNPKQAFTPDFFLAEYELFVEVTTMNQKLVTKKNRKARRLREQHGVRVKVLYQRDYVHLLVKYGLEPPSPETERWGDPRPIDFGFAEDAADEESLADESADDESPARST